MTRAITNRQYTQNTEVTVELARSSFACACAAEIPNISGEAGWLTWIGAEIACAPIATIAPPRSAAPARAGRQVAAAIATTTSATTAATSPKITQPGLSNAFPAVTVWEVPLDAWVSVQL